jgi:hypothetical protein
VTAAELEEKEKDCGASSDDDDEKKSDEIQI